MEIADCREQLRASNLDLHKLLRFFALQEFIFRCILSIMKSFCNIFFLKVLVIRLKFENADNFFCVKFNFFQLKKLCLEQLRNIYKGTK